MGSIDMFLRFSGYNRWMNERLYDVCSRLSEDELRLDMKSFFHSIHGTLNHILLADKVWLGRLTEQRFIVHSLDQTLYMDFPLLAQARMQTDLDIEHLVSELNPEDIEVPITYHSISENKQNTTTKGLILLHLFNHQTHHRGQITTMLIQLGYDYGNTDLMAMPSFKP
ncbi:damage-inducible protein DinB [Allopusillimonas soli]|uniref:Damage-inducible protein DinB n=1 Tax=Allopusillimonas soli TaxID=659016 RepID=A0A853FCF6_9BURK|nr:DinB family protein [Allopusillimonas soli]NYT37342.1 damage-inducible protein DinB [Allopusillimonas soli]TEA74674.1 damage-inducible protein DinB [Allopusillimonas soli]